MDAQPRVIPALLLQDDVLVKTVGFADPTYVGDPVNILSIYNSFEVDEVVLLDIRATVDGRDPDLGLIRQAAEECFIPLAYGGGIRDADTALAILEIGLEKVILNTAWTEDARLIPAIADRAGSQAVIAAIDARREDGGRFPAFTRSGTTPLGLSAGEAARLAEQQGAGEILLTSIDRDGTMQGYDLDLIQTVTTQVSIPVIACGGAGRREDLAAPVRRAGASAVAAGSIFVFRGPQRAVLVNFPSRQEREVLFSDAPTGPPVE